MEEVVQVVTSLFEYFREDINYINSDLKELRQETNDIIHSDL